MAVPWSVWDLYTIYFRDVYHPQPSLPRIPNTVISFRIVNLYLFEPLFLKRTSTVLEVLVSLLFSSDLGDDDGGVQCYDGWTG